MALSTEQIEKITSLFRSSEIDFVEQGIELVEAFIADEEDFRQFLQLGAGFELPQDVTIDVLKSVFADFELEQRTYLSVWALGTLARWNETAKKTSHLNLRATRLRSLPKSIENLSQITELNLSWNHAIIECLRISITNNKVNSLYSLLKHIINSIASTTPNSNYFNSGGLIFR